VACSQVSSRLGRRSGLLQPPLRKVHGEAPSVYRRHSERGGTTARTRRNDAPEPGLAELALLVGHSVVEPCPGLVSPSTAWRIILANHFSYRLGDHP
jgi:hypothetical protein